MSICSRRLQRSLRSTPSSVPAVLLTVTKTSASSVQVSWTTSLAPVQGWTVGRNGTDATGYGPWTSSALPGNTRQQAFTSLVTTSAYTFTLTNLDTGLTYTKTFDMASGTVNVITNFSKTSATDTSITLGWTYSGAALTNYTLTYGSTTQTIAASQTSYTDTDGLSAGTSRSYTLIGNLSGGGTTNTATTTEATTGGAIGGYVWPLRVSTNGRYLVDTNNKPFMWQGDTAWLLCGKCTREEVTFYLDTRLSQGYTVIKFAPMFLPNGKDSWSSFTNRYGANLFTGSSILNLNEAYFTHVDWVVNEIESRGMFPAMFPTWASFYANGSNGNGMLTSSNGQQLGYWFGNRYKTKKIIWTLGGDCSYYETAAWRAFAKGLAIGVTGSEDYSKLLMTFHPGTRWLESTGSSSGAYHNDAWLDFNMAQSSHKESPPRSYDLMTEDYNLTPIKPTIDGEPTYEDHPIDWNVSNGFYRDFHARVANYAAVFAGAFGFTYGHHAVWAMSGGGDPYYDNRTWQSALTRPAGTQMKYLSSLMLSRPFLSRVPDQSIITSSAGSSWTRKQATRDLNGSYLMVHLASGGAVSVDTTKLSSSSARVWWYNPRTGAATGGSTQSVSGSMTFTAPDSNDWVLVIDDASKNYPAPGQ